MKRVNLRFFLILVVTLVTLSVGIFFLHRFQINRNAEGLARLAQERLAEDRVEVAIELFQRYLHYRPNDGEILGQLGNLLLKKAEDRTAKRDTVNRAAQALEKAVLKSPEDIALRRKLAEFLLKKGRFVDAHDHLKLLRQKAAAASRDPAEEPLPEGFSPETAVGIDLSKDVDRAMLELMYAKAAARLGSFEESAKIASSLIGFDMITRQFDPNWQTLPECGEAYELLAALFEERIKDSAAAAVVMDRWTKVLPKDAKGWLSQSRWNRARGKLRLAGEQIGKAAEMMPNNPDVLFTSFEIALSQKDYDKAASIIQTGLDRFAKDERVVRGRALLALQLKEPDKAVELLQEGVRSSPNPATLMPMLCDALLQLNRVDEAEKSIVKLRQMTGTGSPVVSMYEVRLLMSRRRWLAAKQKLDALRPLVGDTPDMVKQVDLLLGVCHENLGQFDEQLEANRRVVAEDPKSLGGRLGVATALLAVGKPKESLAEFELIASGVPKTSIPMIPQLWKGLLQLRVEAELQKPESARDWRSVDALIGLLNDCQDLPEDQKTLAMAEALYRRGMRQEATDSLEAALEKFPNEQRLAIGLGSLWLDAQDLERVRDVLARFPNTSGETVERLILEVQLAEAENTAESFQKLRSIEERAGQLPSDAARRVLAQLASTYLGAGQRRDVERIWSILLRDTPDDLRLLLALFELVREDKNLEQSMRYAEEIGNVAGPSSPQTRFAEAAVLLLQVAASQRERREASPDSEVVQLAEEELEKLAEARNLMIEAENDRPGWFQTQRLFAEIDRLRGNTPAAVERLRKAISLGASNPALTRQLAGLLYADDRLEEARDTIATLGGEETIGLERLKAESAAREGNYEESVEIAEKTVSKESTRSEELMWLGKLYNRAGKGDLAEDTFERALTAAPQKFEIWLALASQQALSGKKGLALKTVGRAAEVLPSPRKELLAAQVNELLGDKDGAEASYLSATQAAPTDLNASKKLAEFLLRRGKMQPAREELGRLVAIGNAEIASEKNWARRTLAGLVASNGTYRDLQKALALLDQNAADDGTLPPEDIALKVSLLAVRQEPKCWRQAVDVLENFRRQNRLSTEQRLLLAQMLENLGRWQECRKELLDIAVLPDISPTVYTLVAERLLEHDEAASARVWLEKLKKREPNSRMTQALTARVAIADNDKATAVAVARLLMPDPDQNKPVDDLGQLAAVAKLMEDLDFEKAAEQVLDRFAKESSEGILAKAAFLTRQKRFPEALAQLESAWNSGSHSQILQAGMQVLREEGQPPNPESVAQLESWITRTRREDPESFALLGADAALRELLGQKKLAIDIYREALQQKKLTPLQTAVISNNLAYLLADPSNAGEALRLIESAIEELGPHPDLLDTRAMVCLAAGESLRAVEDLNEAIIVPTPIRYLHLAVAQVAARSEGAAKVSLEKAKALGLESLHLSTQDRTLLDRVEQAVANAAGA